jgi:hypothetical protein
MFALIILALYGIIMLIYLALAFFIVYHLVRFTASSEFKTIMLIFFIVVTSGLFISNLALFFSINWNLLISNIIS